MSNRSSNTNGSEDFAAVAQAVEASGYATPTAAYSGVDRPVQNIIDLDGFFPRRCAALAHVYGTVTDAEIGEVTIGTSESFTRRTVLVCTDCISRTRHSASQTIEFMLGGFVVRFTPGQLPRPKRELRTK